MSLSQLLISAGALAANPPLAASGLAIEQPRLSGVALSQIVDQGLMPQLDHFFELLMTQGKDVVIDGTRGFNGKDKFLPGKIANGMAYLLVNTPQEDPRFQRYLDGFRRIADLTVDEDNESWGIYYYVSALNKLHQAKLLDRAVSPETLARLKQRLDWRSFVRESDYSLINLPTNYYGVAFSIARLRHLLGWESARSSEILLEKMVNHYQTYSGEFGFSDETDGEGRFDRYSILLIGEICQRFIETGMEVTPQLKRWLRRAVDVVLIRLNPAGDGFDFGRSIGAYGDTAYLEVLSAAAWLGVLKPQERDMAYAFAVRASAKYLEFWVDPRTQSVNLWDGGRRTDAYRGKHRILGENLSLLHQHIYTSKLWNALGYKGRQPSEAFVPWLLKRPTHTLTWFARGEYDRALLTVRDGLRVFSLPLVNGGATQHMNSPYFPIPFSNGLIQGAADAGFPQLLPRFTLADGSKLIPASFIRDVQTTQTGSGLMLSYRQEEMDRIGERAPIKDARLKVETRYEFEAGQIRRIDRVTPTQALQNVKIEIEFASFAERATQEGNRIRFDAGALAEFEVAGAGACTIDTVADKEIYRAPMGQMRTRIRCETTVANLNEPISLAWRIAYR